MRLIDKLLLMFVVEEKLYNSSMFDSVKFLGTHVDATLSMNKMISECIRIPNFSLKKLQNIKHILGIEDMLLLLKSFILSKLDYCNILLCNKSKNQLQPLQIVLNQGIRFAYSLKKRESTTAFLKRAHILPVYYCVQIMHHDLQSFKCSYDHEKQPYMPCKFRQ